MRVVWLFLAVTSFLIPIAAQAEPQKDAGDPIQAVFDRLGKMPLPEQQAWLKQLEDRALRAAQLTLKPEEAIRQQKEVRSKLHQKLITWKVLREVVDDMNASEKNAIDRLSQRYRTAIDETFHNQPDAFAKRQQAWLDVDNEWKLAGSPFEQQDRLIDWLEAAIADAAKPQVAESKNTVEPQVTEEPAKPGNDKGNSPIFADTKIGTVPAEKPLPLPKPAEVSPERNPAAAQVPLQRRDGDQPPSTDVPSSPPATVARRSEPLDTPATDVEGKPLPRRESGPISELPPKAVEETPQKVADMALPTETQVQPPSMIDLPQETDVSLAEELPPDSVEIKVDELAARIGGCNMAFRALEMELDEKGPWTAARLDPLVERLEMLAIRRSDLDMFREAVPEEKRASLDPLPTLKGVVSQVATRIVEARKLASGSHFNGTDSERKAELELLDGLSRRLAGLTEPQ